MSNLPYLVPFYGLASALLFALSNHFSHMGLERTDARTGTIVSIATSAIAYWLFAPLFLKGWYWLTAAALLFAAVGIIRPVLSTMLATSSIKLMGPTLTSSLTAVTPIFGAIFAILILGERMSAPIAVGTAAVVAGAMVAAWNPKGLKRTWPLWAIALPLGASLIRATGHIATKYGLMEVESPSFAVLVGNTVSLGAAVLFFSQGAGLCLEEAAAICGSSRPASAMPCRCNFSTTPSPWATWWRLCRSSRQRRYSRCCLGVLFFGRESITWRTVATIALIVPGVILVALHTAR